MLMAVLAAVLKAAVSTQARSRLQVRMPVGLSNGSTSILLVSAMASPSVEVIRNMQWAHAVAAAGMAAVATMTTPRMRSSLVLAEVAMWVRSHHPFCWLVIKKCRHRQARGLW